MIDIDSPYNHIILFIMLPIDTPYNHIILKESTSIFNPDLIANKNWPIPGDDAYFMFWKGKRLGITRKNKAPGK